MQAAVRRKGNAQGFPLASLISKAAPIKAKTILEIETWSGLIPVCNKRRAIACAHEADRVLMGRRSIRQEYRNHYRSTEVQEFRSTGVQEFRSCRMGRRS